MDKIEEHTLAIFNSIKEKLPEFHRISFEVDIYGHREGSFCHGFIHLNDIECEIFDSIKDLKRILKREGYYND